jgi:uncharacterized protein (TIGR03435 family)
MKNKIVIVVSIVVLLAVVIIAFRKISEHRYTNFHWQTNANLNSELLQKIPPLLKIVPTKFPNGGGGVSIDGPKSDEFKAIGLGYTIENLVETAHGIPSSRITFSTSLPKEKYDFIVTLPSGTRKSLQQEIQRQFGIIGKTEAIETNVLLLEIKNSNADGLRPADNSLSYTGDNPGKLCCTNQSLSVLANMLESRFRTRILDNTGSTNHFDFTVTWDEYGNKVGNQYPNYPNLAGLKQALLEQLGLELVPSREPIEMLVVEKAN